VQHLSSGFVRCTEMINQEPNSASRMTSKSPIPTPLISSTPAEKFFYERFTSEIPNNLPRYVAAKVCSKFFIFFCYKLWISLFSHLIIFSQHIFQVDDVWIDKRTLALSMRSGCWFNPSAMFAFCKMFNSEQQERLQFRELYEGEIGYFYMNKKTTVRNLINYQFYIYILFIFAKCSYNCIH